MAALHFRGLKSGKGVGVLHGVFTVSGLSLMLTGVLHVGGGGWLFAGFLVVAAGGAYLFSRQMRGKPWPGMVILAHGGLALVLLVTLGLWLGDQIGGEDNPVLPASPEVGEVQE